jgi:hypothetical protein
MESLPLKPAEQQFRLLQGLCPDDLGVPAARTLQHRLERKYGELVR